MMCENERLIYWNHNTIERIHCTVELHPIQWRGRLCMPDDASRQHWSVNIKYDCCQQWPHSRVRGRENLTIQYGSRLQPTKPITNCQRIGSSWDKTLISLQGRHNGHDGVSNHQPHHCLLNHLTWSRSKKTSKLRVTGLCAGNSRGTGEFRAQMASNAKNASIWLRNHVLNLHQQLCWYPLTLAMTKLNLFKCPPFDRDCKTR